MGKFDKDNIAWATDGITYYTAKVVEKKENNTLSVCDVICWREGMTPDRRLVFQPQPNQMTFGKTVTWNLDNFLMFGDFNDEKDTDNAGMHSEYVAKLKSAMSGLITSISDDDRRILNENGRR